MHAKAWHAVQALGLSVADHVEFWLLASGQSAQTLQTVLSQQVRPSEKPVKLHTAKSSHTGHDLRCVHSVVLLARRIGNLRVH